MQVQRPLLSNVDRDLRVPGDDRPPAQVQWTALKKEPDVYQGALQYKDQYTKLFLRQTAETIRNGSYDVSKLARVLDALIEECSSLAANATLVGG